MNSQENDSVFCVCNEKLIKQSISQTIFCNECMKPVGIGIFAYTCIKCSNRYDLCMECSQAQIRIMKSRNESNTYSDKQDPFANYHYVCFLITGFIKQCNDQPPITEIIISTCISYLCDVPNTESLTKLTSVMKGYVNCKRRIDYSELQIQEILNNFLCLLQYHDDDNQFEYIYSRLGGFCDIVKCDVLQKAHNNTIQNKDNHDKIAKTQILDKIHNFYSHSFDIRHRINLKNSVSIFCENNQLGKAICDAMNASTNQMSQLMSTFTPRYRKYSQLSTQVTEHGKFKHGFQFKYGYIGEYDGKIAVSKRYNSLKEEVISNGLNFKKLTVEMFNCEHTKAKIHFSSRYCKQSYVAYKYIDNVKKEFTLHHVLALIIYCNYTDLQYHFSKTYRE
eukprot:5562_1